MTSSLFSEPEKAAQLLDTARHDASEKNRIEAGLKLVKDHVWYGAMGIDAAVLIINDQNIHPSIKRAVEDKLTTSISKQIDGLIRSGERRGEDHEIEKRIRQLLIDPQAPLSIRIKIGLILVDVMFEYDAFEKQFLTDKALPQGIREDAKEKLLVALNKEKDVQKLIDNLLDSQIPEYIREKIGVIIIDNEKALKKGFSGELLVYLVKSNALVKVRVLAAREIIKKAIVDKNINLIKEYYFDKSLPESISKEAENGLIIIINDLDNIHGLIEFCKSNFSHDIIEAAGLKIAKVAEPINIYILRIIMHEKGITPSIREAIESKISNFIKKDLIELRELITILHDDKLSDELREEAGIKFIEKCSTSGELHHREDLLSLLSDSNIPLSVKEAAEKSIETSELSIILSAVGNGDEAKLRSLSLKIKSGSLKSLANKSLKKVGYELIKMLIAQSRLKDIEALAKSGKTPKDVKEAALEGIKTIKEGKKQGGFFSRLFRR